MRLRSQKRLHGGWKMVCLHTAVVVTALALSGCVPRIERGPREMDVLVGSCYTNNVLRFDGRTGEYMGEFIQAGSGGLTCPEGEMILGEDGLLYVSSFSFPPLRHPWEPVVPAPRTPAGRPVFEEMPHAVTYNDQVLRFDGRTGRFVDVFVPPSSILNGPHGLAFTKEGDAFIATRFSSSLLVYDGKTNAVRQILIENGTYKLQTDIAPDLMFRDLNSISLGPDGRVYVASYQTGDIFRFDQETGALVDRFVSTRDAHGMNHPHNVLFGPDGNLYVTNITPEGHSVLRFEGRTGRFLGVFVDGKEPKIEYASDIVFAPDGNLLLVDCLAGAVFRYDGRTGRFLNALVPPGRGLPSGATSIVLIPK